MFQSTIENPPPIPVEGDLPPGWIITKDEYFVKRCTGQRNSNISGL
jgi:hypothetical protein